MRLSDCGEYALHDWLKRTLRRAPCDVFGIGDDASVVDLGLPSKFLLLSSDRVPLSITGPDAGRFCAAHNMSDIIAMGADPLGMLLNVYLPRDCERRTFEQIVEGAERECAKYGAYILGGDVKEDDKEVVVGTSVGLVDRDGVLLRTGAEPGAILAVTSTSQRRLGARWAWKLSQTFRLTLPGPVADRLRELHDVTLDLPYKEMLALRSVGGVLACLDVTEGLPSSLAIVCGASGVGARLHEDLLLQAVDRDAAIVAAELDTDETRMAFSPGYDWENLVVIAEGRYEVAKEAVGNAGGDLLRIGEVVSDNTMTCSRSDGTECVLCPFGDEKFADHPWRDKAPHWRAHQFFACPDSG